jgi:hypothetical protein
MPVALCTDREARNGSPTERCLQKLSADTYTCTQTQTQTHTHGACDPGTECSVDGRYKVTVTGLLNCCPRSSKRVAVASLTLQPISFSRLQAVLHRGRRLKRRSVLKDGTKKGPRPWFGQAGRT